VIVTVLDRLPRVRPRRRARRDRPGLTNPDDRAVE
jgi:hypothetical protein